jgi:uncharacterized membrane protein YbjE (DUF340 family)
MKDSLIITAFFAVGVACGLLHIIPDGFINGRTSFYVLCALMFSVGMSIGCDSATLRSFRQLNPRMALLPFVTIAGTLAGAMASSVVLPHRELSDCLAVGSGMGYYSLSSIFITEYRGAELGTVALLANIFRELAALLLAPFLARRFGKLAPISVGGATTMDTTLPVITRSVGPEYVVVSVFHGFVTDFSVPFLVTFFCTL